MLADSGFGLRAAGPSAKRLPLLPAVLSVDVGIASAGGHCQRGGGRQHDRRCVVADMRDFGLGQGRSFLRFCSLHQGNERWNKQRDDLFVRLWLIHLINDAIPGGSERVGLASVSPEAHSPLRASSPD